MSPAKEDLDRWRQQGMSNTEIADMLGKSTATVNCLFSKYKIRPRKRSVPDEDIEIFVRMRRAGSSTKEIAEKTGYACSTINNYLKAAGLIRNREEAAVEVQEPKLPEMFLMAPEKEPKAAEVMVKGHRYIDITDFVIRW